MKELLEKVNLSSDLKIKREGLGKSPLLIACTYGQLPLVEEFLQVCHNLYNLQIHRKVLDKNPKTLSD